MFGSVLGKTELQLGADYSLNNSKSDNFMGIRVYENNGYVSLLRVTFI